MMLAALLIVAVAVQSAQVPAGPNARIRPATSFSCNFATAEGKAYTISSSLEALPVGWDPNQERTTELQGDAPAPLTGRAGFTAGNSGPFFREYQIRTRDRTTGAAYNINLELRRGGHGVANITLYESRTPPEPYDFIASGLCTADFEPVSKGKQ